MWIFYLRDYYHMKILSVLVLAVLISVIEIWLAFDSFQGAKPFPWNEVLYISADHIARDILILAIGASIYIYNEKFFSNLLKIFLLLLLLGLCTYAQYLLCCIGLALILGYKLFCQF